MGAIGGQSDNGIQAMFANRFYACLCGVTNYVKLYCSLFMLMAMKDC